MNLLIDTHVLIWWSQSSGRLGHQAKELLSEPENSIWVSAASIWEIAIKTRLGRLDFGEALERRMAGDLERHGFRALPIDFRHALGVRALPDHHRDPFDRLLIAQARIEDLTLLTVDPAIMAYDVRTFDASQ